MNPKSFDQTSPVLQHKISNKCYIIFIEIVKQGEFLRLRLVRVLGVATIIAGFYISLLLSDPRA
jgi:hypothetical protein